MATTPSEKLELRWFDMAIAVLPTALVICGSKYLQEFGGTIGNFEMIMVADSHLEAAGRLRMLAASLLTTVAGLAAILYFAWNLRLFGKSSLRIMLGLYVALAGYGVYMVSGKHGGNSETLMTRPVLCAPLELIDRAEPGARATLRVWPAKKQATDPEPDDARRCRESPTFRTLGAINNWHRYLLVLILPAAVLGAISCLGEAIGKKKSIGDSVERLKIWVYLTAVMFVAGLLFMSALLRWPGFAYQGAAQAAYNAHVSAYVLYLGILYTLFVAAFYLPIYARISQRQSRRSPARGAAEPGAEPIHPLDLGKIMLGVFAPAVAGLLGDVIKF